MKYVPNIKLCKVKWKEKARKLGVGRWLTCLYCNVLIHITNYVVPTYIFFDNIFKRMRLPTKILMDDLRLKSYGYLFNIPLNGGGFGSMEFVYG